MDSQTVDQAIAGDLDLTSLSVDELHELNGDLAARFRDIDPGPGAAPDEATLEEMARIVEATDRVQAEILARAENGEPAPAAQTAAGRFANNSSRVAALRRRVGAVTASSRRPRIVLDSALTAAGGMPGLGIGEQVDWSTLNASIHRKIELMGGADGEQRAVCASLTWAYPASRILPGDDAWATTRRMDEALSVDAVMDSVASQGGMHAVVAAGGICGPVPVDYSIQLDTTTARPIRDSLPAFQATRGGIRFVPPPSFASVGTSATAVWTSANDANPTSPTAKPVQEFACPSAVEELVDAIPTRLQFSNLQGRFSPEMVEANTELAMANAARMAEINLLARMSVSSIKTGAGALVSFARDWLALADLLATSMRYRHRLPETFPIRIYAPSWALGAVRTDILRELAHDRTGSASDQLAVATSYITGLFAVRNLIPTWTLDSLPKSVAGNTLSAAGAWDYPDQSFAAPATTAALSAAPPDASAGSAVAGTWWPSRLVFFMFPEGTHVFLDGGKLDLGVIRDSTLNATNKYQTFVEPFEGLAKRGYESLQVTVPVRATGVSVAAAAAPSNPPYAY
ncbi:hypothetical protein FRAHR75_770002 [Frankia sp. Hr75.2]|nr:hypothetical protein FRAHR75_770002 [Frankia sp. Hr75.2]